MHTPDDGQALNGIMEMRQQNDTYLIFQHKIQGAAPLHSHVICQHSHMMTLTHCPTVMCRLNCKQR